LRERDALLRSQKTIAAEIEKVNRQNKTQSIEIQALASEADQLYQINEMFRQAFLSKSENFRSTPSSGAVTNDLDAAHLQTIIRRLNDPSELVALEGSLIQHFSFTSDTNLKVLSGTYHQVLTEGQPYWDVRKAVNILSTELRPKTFLEVGTRTGWSGCAVFHRVLSVLPESCRSRLH